MNLNYYSYLIKRKDEDMLKQLKELRIEARKRMTTKEIIKGLQKLKRI